MPPSTRPASIETTPRPANPISQGLFLTNPTFSNSAGSAPNIFGASFGSDAFSAYLPTIWVFNGQVTGSTLPIWNEPSTSTYYVFYQSFLSASGVVKNYTNRPFDFRGEVQLGDREINFMNVVTFSATPTFDASTANTFKITLTGNVTSSTLSNVPASTGTQYLYFIICQDATGSRTFVWPTNVKGGMAIGSTLSTCSAQTFVTDGTNAYAISTGVANM